MTRKTQNGNALKGRLVVL